MGSDYSWRGRAMKGHSGEISLGHFGHRAMSLGCKFLQGSHKDVKIRGRCVDLRRHAYSVNARAIDGDGVYLVLLQKNARELGGRHALHTHICDDTGPVRMAGS